MDSEFNSSEDVKSEITIEDRLLSLDDTMCNVSHQDKIKEEAPETGLNTYDDSDKALRSSGAIKSTSQSDVQDVNPKRKRATKMQESDSDEDDENVMVERPSVIKKPKLDSISNDRGNSELEVCNASALGVLTSRIPTTSPEDTAFQKKIFEVLLHIKEQNEQILAMLKEQTTQNTTRFQALPDDMPVELPLSCQSDIKLIEEYLANQINLSAMRSYLSSLGGKDITAKTNRILKVLLTDEVASNYSFFGKRLQKKAFCDLVLKTAVVSAVKISSPQTTEKEIEDNIKVWLKHSPQRVKYRKNHSK